MSIDIFKMGTKHISGSSEDAPVASRDVQEMSQKMVFPGVGGERGGFFIIEKMRQDALRSKMVSGLEVANGSRSRKV